MRGELMRRLDGPYVRVFSLLADVYPDIGSLSPYPEDGRWRSCHQDDFDTKVNKEPGP
jgi:hypothetical protein